MKRSLRIALATALLVGVPALASAETPVVSGLELGVSLGSYATVQTYEGGGTTDIFGYASLQGRTRFIGWLTLDGWFLAGPAFTRDLSPSSYSLALRVGVATEHVDFAVGPVVNLAPGSANVAQWLPSLTVRAGAGKWHGVLGLFDRPEQTILRAGVEYEGFGLAYVLLAGAEIYGRWKLTDLLALDARLLIAQHAFGSGLGTATVGITWFPGGQR